MQRNIACLVAASLSCFLYTAADLRGAEASPDLPRVSPCPGSPADDGGPDVVAGRSALTAAQQDFIRRLRSISAEDRRRMCLCLAPGTPREYVEQLDEMMYGGQPPRYEQTTRWPGGQGDPLELTYSFVPDGVTVPPNVGMPGGANQIHSLFDGLFGGPSVWQDLFAQSLAAWSAVSGLSHRRIGDDGAPLFGSPGPTGRGDVRISAIPLDGGGGVLAYNNFPQPGLGDAGGGDMVLDSGDGSSWSNPANNYRFLRNVVTHEHGHGVGLMHVCPDNGTKLMEPFIHTGFDGPQHDDVRGAQRHYGDAHEPNDTAGSAADLGVLGTTTLTLHDLSLDDNSDDDYFALTVTTAADLSATVSPVGFSYLSGAQVFFGCWFAPGSNVNSLTVLNLDLALIDTDGSNTLISAAGQPAGQAESFTGFPLPGPGQYFLHVHTAGSANDVQLYDLNLVVTAAAGTGDFDGDGDVDLVDFAAFQRCFGPVVAGCEPGDFQPDGKVDDADYTQFAAVLVGP